MHQVAIPTEQVAQEVIENLQEPAEDVIQFHQEVQPQLQQS